MVNYNDSSRTLSGIDERSVVSLSLPSSIAAISIGGNIGTAGQVIAKNNITNKLEWDAVDDITIPDHSIVGDKLALDISFTTTGNISLLNNTVNATLMANVLRYVGFLTGNGNLDLYSNFIGGHRWLAFDYQTNNFTIDNPNNFFVGNLRITNNGVGALETFVLLNQNGTIASTGNISTEEQLISTKATATATEYGLDITGNAKIGGNLTVVGDIDLDDIITDELTVKGKAIFQTDPAVATTRKTEIDSTTGAIKQYDNFNPPQQTTFLNILNGQIEAQSLILEGSITQQTPGQVLTTDLQIINGVIDMKQIKQTNQVSPVGNYQVELRGAGKFEKLLGGGVDDQVAVFCDGDLLITGNIVNQAGNIHTVVGEFRVVNSITGNVFNRFRVQPLRDPNAQPTPLIPTVDFLADEIRFRVENNNPNVANPVMLFMDADVTNVPRLLTEGRLTIHKGLDIGSTGFNKIGSYFEVDDATGQITLQSTTDINLGKVEIQKLQHQYVASDDGGRLQAKGELTLKGRLVVDGILDTGANTTPVPNLDTFNEITGNELRLSHRQLNINTSTYQNFNNTANTTINGALYTNNNTNIILSATPPTTNPNAQTNISLLAVNTGIGATTTMSFRAFATSTIDYLDHLGNDFIKMYPNLLVPTIVNPPPTVKGLTENLHTFMNSGCNWSKNGQGGDGHYVGFGNRNAGSPDANPTLYRKEDFDITIQNTGDVNGNGGILFNKPEPRIIGEPNTKTKCMNLDLSDASNNLVQTQVEPFESLGIFHPNTEYKFPCDRLNIPEDQWLSFIYGFITLSDNFFAPIPPNMYEDFDSPRFRIGFSAYQERRRSGAGSSVQSGNRDMFANIFYTLSSDNPPFDTSNPRHLSVQDPNKFFISGGPDIQPYPPPFGGNGTTIWWEQTFTLDGVVDLQPGDTIRVYPCMSNNVPFESQEPAFVDLRSGRNLGNNSGDRQEWLVWVKPLPQYVNDYQGGGGSSAGGFIAEGIGFDSGLTGEDPTEDPPYNDGRGEPLPPEEPIDDY